MLNLINYLIKGVTSDKTINYRSKRIYRC